MLLSTHTLEHPSTIAARCSPELSHTLCSLVVHFQQIKRHGLATLPYYHTPSVLSSTNFIRVNRETYVSGGKSPRYRRPLPINKAWGWAYKPIGPSPRSYSRCQTAQSFKLLASSALSTDQQFATPGQGQQQQPQHSLGPSTSSL